MKPTNITEAYKKFKKENPQLAFELEDKYSATFLFDDYERWDVGQNAIDEGVRELENAISFLQIDAEVISELVYMVDFLIAYKEAELRKETEWKIEVDLNKLKYCKTVIAYIDEEYTETILSILDYLQDQMVDEAEVDKDRVFFFPEVGYCQIRKDIQRKKEGVPVGDGYYTDNHPLPYRWRDEDFFEVLYKGQWSEATSIDFDFPFEHLRVE